MLTVLLSDVEGSSRLWAEWPDEAPAAIASQYEIIAAAVKSRGGELLSDRAEGDSALALFTDPLQAVLAALELHDAMSRQSWPADISLRVRVGIHSERGDDHEFAALRGARVRDLAHGREVLLSSRTASAVREHLPAGYKLVDAGRHRLSRHTLPERLYAISGTNLEPSSARRNAAELVLHNLPAAGSLIGREGERREIAQRLRSVRAVTLTGVGGIGKTRLAVAVGQDAVASRDGDGVWLLSVAAHGGVDAMARGAASAMGVVAANTSSAERLASLIGELRMLLILDGCEAELEASAAFVNFLPAGVRVLATSRQPLAVSGEDVLEVGPLTAPPPEVKPTLSDLSQWPATALFLARAREANPRYLPLDAHAVDIAAIARSLDGHPLALELAAGRTRILAPAQVRRRLVDPLGFLAGGSRAAPRRLRSLRACLGGDNPDDLPAWVHKLQRSSAG